MHPIGQALKKKENAILYMDGGTEKTFFKVYTGGSAWALQGRVSTETWSTQGRF